MSDIEDNISESSDTCHIPESNAADPPAKEKKGKKQKKNNIIEDSSGN